MPWYKNKIILLVVSIVVLFVIIISLFILQRDSDNTTVLQDNSPIELTWWKPFYGGEVYNDIINGFTSIPGNQNVKINLIKKDYGQGYYNDLISDIARDAGPDIYTLRNDDLPAYQEFAAPISIFQGAELLNYQNNFVDLAVRDTMVVDKVYGVTSYVDNLQLYYNENLLSQAGIAIVPKTWTEVDRQLNQLNKRNTDGITFRQYAISLGTGGLNPDGRGDNINRHEDILPALIFQNGAQLFDYQTNQVVFGNDRNKQDLNSNQVTDRNIDFDEDNPTLSALQFYLDFADLQTSRYSWNTAAPNNIDAFVEGRLAYIVHYSYLRDVIGERNPRLQYGISDLPQVDLDNKRTYGFFFMDSLNRQLTRNPRKYQKAQEFMRYLSLTDTQRVFLEKTGLPAAKRTLIKEQQTNRDLAVFANGSLYAQNYLKKDIDQIEDMWSNMIQRVQYEGMELKESLNIAIQDYNRITNADPVLR